MINFFIGLVATELAKQVTTGNVSSVSIEALEWLEKAISSTPTDIDDYLLLPSIKALKKIAQSLGGE